VRDPLKVARLLRGASKCRDRLPDRKQHFLHQVIAVSSFSEAIDGMMQNCGMIHNPALERLTLLFSIHCLNC